MRSSYFVFSLIGLSILLPRPAHADETQACIDASDKGQLLRIDKHLRDARTQFAACAHIECPGEIREACGRWLSETQRAIPEIAFTVKDSEGRDADAVRVSVDGIALAEGYHGAAIPLDPGEHSFRFDVAGRSVERTYRLVQGEHDRREVIALAPAKAPAARGEPARATSPSPNGSSILAFVLGGAGFVGLGVGSALGLLAIAHNHDAHCDAQNVCTSPDERRTAQGYARGSTIAFLAGGALLAGGIALIVLAPKRESAVSVAVGPSISSSSAGGALEAVW